MASKLIKVRIADLKETENNPRTITKEDFERLKNSLQEDPEFLEAREIVVDENLTILGGHQRVRALQQLGNNEIEVKQVIGWSEEKKRKFVIKDNLQNGQWDFELLANAWDDLPLDEWGAGIKWADELEQPTDLDADGKDDGIYIKISFKSEDEANRFLDEMRADINKYDCSMTTHGGAL